MPTKRTDVIIIGGGVIGSSIAYYLSRLGITSTVFEMNRFASGASGATAGMISPLWHIDHTHEALLAMGVRSLEVYPELTSRLAEFGVDPQFHKSGVIKVALTPHDVKVLKNDLAWQRELGLGVRWLESDEILEREPEVTPHILGGAFSPNEGHVTGKRLVDGFLHAASRLGATCVERTRVIRFQTSGRRVIGVRTTNESYHSDHTILAAGPWTGITKRWIHETLPIRPVKGQRILLRKTKFILNSIVLSSIGANVPQLNGDVLVGATRQEGKFDQEITVDAITSIVANAKRILPLLRDASFVEAKSGVRPGSPDDVPILGPVPGWDGLSVASGHDHAGIMLAPATGEMMADYIRTGETRQLHPFSLSRFDHQF